MERLMRPAQERIANTAPAPKKRAVHTPASIPDPISPGPVATAIPARIDKLAAPSVSHMPVARRSDFPASIVIRCSSGLSGVISWTTVPAPRRARDALVIPRPILSAVIAVPSFSHSPRLAFTLTALRPSWDVNHATSAR